MKNKYNGMCIGGFISSIFLSIIPIVLCFMGLNTIKETKEKGRGFAIAGITLSMIKIIFFIIIFILVAKLAVSEDAPVLTEEDYCSQAYSCVYNEPGNNWICKYKDEKKKEKDIECLSPASDSFETSTEYDGEYIDYDKE